MTTKVKCGERHSSYGQLFRCWEQTGSIYIRGTIKPQNLKGRLCNKTNCWKYLGITLAYAVPVCRLWASAEVSFCLHCLVLGKPASRSSCTTLIKKKEIQMSWKRLETFYKGFEGWWKKVDVEPTVPCESINSCSIYLFRFEVQNSNLVCSSPLKTEYLNKFPQCVFWVWLKTSNPKVSLHIKF